MVENKTTLCSILHTPCKPAVSRSIGQTVFRYLRIVAVCLPDAQGLYSNHNDQRAQEVVLPFGLAVGLGLEMPG